MGNQQTYTIEGCAGCCQACTPSDTECNECTDVTPSQYTVTFSEVQMCGCTYSLGSSIKVEWIGGSELVNGLHTLTNKPGSCTWRKVISNAVKVSYYSNTNCSGTPDFIQDNVDLVIEMYINGGGWYIDCYPDAFTPARFFQDDAVPAIMDGANILCSQVPDFENNRTECFANDIDASSYGYGGSATVVCV